MFSNLFTKIKNYLGALIFSLFVLFIFYFLLNLRGQNIDGYKFFEIKSGESFWQITSNLYKEKLIRSRLSFVLWGMLTGKILRIQEGTYKLNFRFSIPEILQSFYKGENKEAKITIPEGLTFYDIDYILSQNNVLKEGELINFILNSNLNIEGRLFPDTYYFFYNSKPEDVIRKMTENFNLKIKPLLANSQWGETTTLILASFLEKEIPDFEEKKIAAGILLKRLKNNIPLQVDATICYIKILKNQKPTPCLPLLPLDFKIDSPYNTYIYKGLTPTPISNPSISSVLAVLEAKETNYWYYLTDPKTKNTIFSVSLEEHNQNKLKYLKNND